MKWYGKYGRKVSWNLKLYGKNRAERQVESWKDMENMDEKGEKIWKIRKKIVKR